MTYRIRGLDPAPYKPLHRLSDDVLVERGIVRMEVDQKPCFPCRISLTDRDVGERVLLLNHISLDGAGPYRASHAIFVAETADEAADFVDVVPPALAVRVLSLRGFDDNGMMVDAVLTQPGVADEAIRAMFGEPKVSVVHVHYAVRGCFAARIERA